jgi:hypothetical protein
MKEPEERIKSNNEEEEKTIGRIKQLFNYFILYFLEKANTKEKKLKKLQIQL